MSFQPGSLWREGKKEQELKEVRARVPLIYLPKKGLEGICKSREEKLKTQKSGARDGAQKP